MYPLELGIKDTAERNTSASYLDLLLTIERDGQLHSSIFDKHKELNFHMTKYSFLSIIFQSFPAYGVFISHRLRYAVQQNTPEIVIQEVLWSIQEFQLNEIFSLARMLNAILKVDQVQWLPNRSGLNLHHFVSLIPNLTFIKLQEVSAYVSRKPRRAVAQGVEHSPCDRPASYPEEIHLR